jgi:apolipoprotein N-acyltransferase
MFQQRDKQVGMDCVWAGVAWTVAVLLTLTGTTVGLIWAEESIGRVACLTLYAHSMLVLGLAIVLTVRIHGRRQTRRILDALELGHDVEQRVRRMR